MKVALLGLPQAGKRTLFTLLTRRQVPEGRKETDILEGQVPVRDERVDKIAEMLQPEKTKYAETTFVLCPDVVSADGKRPWVDAARRCELLCCLIREFSSAQVYHPDGSVDAARDRVNLSTELFLADLELIENRLTRIGKEKRAGLSPAQALEEKVLLRCKEELEQEHYLKDMAWDERDLGAVRHLGLLTLKPVLWAYNTDDDRVGGDAAGRFALSCQIEKEIMDLEDVAERMAYLKDLGLDASGADRLNHAAYDALGLMSFYTMGKDEVRAWTIRKGSVAPTAAGKIHSDIERGFIRVEVTRYDDLVALGSEAAVKQHGKLELKGRDYVIQDGDICSFLFNV